MVVLDVNDIIDVLNNFYNDMELENKVENSYKQFEYELKDNQIIKYSYVYIEFNDGNISNIISGDWFKEYEIIDCEQLVNEYRDISKLYKKVKGYTVSDYINKNYVKVDFYGNQLDKLLKKIAKHIINNYDIGNDCNTHRTVYMIAQDVFGANEERAMKICEIVKVLLK